MKNEKAVETDNIKKQTAQMDRANESAFQTDFVSNEKLLYREMCTKAQNLESILTPSGLLQQQLYFEDHCVCGINFSHSQRSRSWRRRVLFSMYLALDEER